MQIRDLKPNARNPRKISDEQLDRLKKTIEEFGDLSGLVYNELTGRLVGGHQRSKVLPPDAEIVIDFKFDTPNRTGTTAKGHVTINGDSFQYRQVRWDEKKELAANIAANSSGGEWDFAFLPELLIELDTANMDMELTGFSPIEIEDIVVPKDKKNKAPKNCPHCGKEL